MRDLSCFDLDLLASLGIDALAGLPLSDGEGAKADQSNRIALFEAGRYVADKRLKGSFAVSL